jgi:hypothetical protein
MAITVLPTSTPLLSDGGGDGTLTALDVSGFVTNAIARVSASGQPTKAGKIRSISGNVITLISLVDGKPLDLGSYRVFDRARITVGAQTVTAGSGPDARRNLPTGHTSALVGSAVLVAGTVTVSNLRIKAGSNVMLTRKVTGGTVGHLTLGTVVAGTSFVIDSSSNTDTSTVSWQILD